MQQDISGHILPTGYVVEINEIGLYGAHMGDHIGNRMGYLWSFYG